MARTTSHGLHVWDLETDIFDHTLLADNWDKIDALLGASSQSVETLAALPTTNLFPGRLVMLSAPDSGFPAWSLMRYDGTSWRNVGGVDVLAAVPTLGNYAGRLVLLTTGSGSFAAFTLIRYDGSAWDAVGGSGAGQWGTINTGNGAQNMQGVSTTGDPVITSGARGFVLTDRTTGVRRRFYLDNGYLRDEVVT